MEWASKISANRARAAAATSPADPVALANALAYGVAMSISRIHLVRVVTPFAAAISLALLSMNASAGPLDSCDGALISDRTGTLASTDAPFRYRSPKADAWCERAAPIFALQLRTTAGFAYTESSTPGGSGTVGVAGIVDAGAFVEARIMDYAGLRFGVVGMSFHGDRTDGFATLGEIQFVNYTGARWFSVQSVAVGYDFQSKNVVVDLTYLPSLNFPFGGQRDWTLGPCVRTTIDGPAIATTLGIALRWGNYGPPVVRSRST